MQIMRSYSLSRSSALLEVGILDLLDSSILLLLIFVCFCSFVTESIDALKSLILLCLDLVELGGDFGVSFGESLRFGVVELFLEFSNLGLDIVDTLLLL